MRGPHLYPMSSWGVATLLLLAAWTLRADAQCTTVAEASAIRTSIQRATDCNYKILRNGLGTTCATVTPPSCAGTIVADTVALTYGPNNPPSAKVDTRALRKQLFCQQKVGRAAASFIGRKLELLIRGSAPAEADTKARTYLAGC